MNFLTKFACRHHSTKKNYHERRGTQFLKVAVVPSPLKLLFVCRVSIQDGDDDGFEIQTMIITGSGRKCIGFKLNCNIIPQIQALKYGFEPAKVTRNFENWAHSSLKFQMFVAIIEILQVMFPGATGEQLFCDTCFQQLVTSSVTENMTPNDP